jgi:hypothetical protein
LGITQQTGIEEFNGILGLAPDYSTNGPSYISYLYNQGVIVNKILAIYIGDLTNSAA